MSEAAYAAEQTVMLTRPPKRSTARPIGCCTSAPPIVPTEYARESDVRERPSSAIKSSTIKVIPLDVPKKVVTCPTVSTTHMTQP